ncbi:DUF6366 family protein [Pseudalkalibacillus sp. A8]|uniref:DUF6366 family protein n=1 Tax=Pseudalkalibacillus sp. A8 TaxID=3382641 RepID=UPI0038B4FBEC
MENNGEIPKVKRERLWHKELKNNPVGNMRDASNRANGSNLADLVGNLGLKGTGLLIIILILIFLTVSLFS